MPALRKAVDKVDERWAKFIDLKLSGLNAKDAALQVGFSESYADVITTRFPDKVRKSLLQAMEAQGITADKIAQKINVLLDAEKITKTFRKGEVVELVEEEDKMAIDKGLTHAIKVRGDYTPESVPPQDVTIIKEQKNIYVIVQNAEEQLRKELEV